MPFEMAEHQKLTRLEYSEYRSLLQLVREDDFVKFMEEIAPYLPLTRRTFFMLSEEAINSSSLKVCSYLREVQNTKLLESERKKYVLSLYSELDEIRFRWILNQFDPEVSVQTSSSNELTKEVAMIFKDSKAYLERFWIYSENFLTLSEDTQVEIGIILFTAHAKFEWILFKYKEGLPDHSAMFRVIINKHLSKSCFIYGQILTISAMNGLRSWEAIAEPPLHYYLSRCVNCHKSHIWDAFEMAIKHHNLVFLRALIGTVPLSVMNEFQFSYGALAHLVSSSPRREEMAKLLAKSNVIKNPLRWYVIYNWYRLVMSNNN